MKVKKFAIETLETIIGAFIMAVGVSLFLLPNQLSSGGISGVATITYYLLNIPMGTMILVINVPLFILAIYKIGKSFFIKSMIGTVFLSIFIDFLDQLEPLTNDRFLACIYGGIVIGFRNSYYFKS
ncbi:MAG: YitT family protein [Clostridia bacterium]|nr:YitT family protein [Clostridia bacterium]